MTNPTPIPEGLKSTLSSRGRQTLERAGIATCEELVSWQEKDLARVSGVGRKTTAELLRLQELVLEDVPELACYRHSRQAERRRRLLKYLEDFGTAAEFAGERVAGGPPQWSILNRTLPDLFGLPAPDFPLEEPPPLATLAIASRELDRLRGMAIFPEDPADVVAALTAGYLAQAGISDDTLQRLLDHAARACGSRKVSAASLPATAVSDTSLYADLPPNPVASLWLPRFPFPALLADAGKGAAVSWQEVARVTERTVIEVLGFSVTALHALRHLWQLKEVAATMQHAELAGLPAAAFADFQQLCEGYLRLVLQPRRANGEQVPGGPCTTRNYGIVTSYLGVRWPRLTLEEIGTREQLSRERIRQVVAKMVPKLQTTDNLEQVAYLWLVVDDLLVSVGGVERLDLLAARLQAVMGWKEANPVALHNFLALSPRYSLEPAFPAQPLRIRLVAGRCQGCATARAALLAAVEAASDSGLSLAGAREAMRASCQTGCCRPGERSDTFSDSFLCLLADQEEKIVRRRDTLYTRHEWERTTRTMVSVMEEILLTSRREMHFKEVHREYNRIRGAKRQVSENNAHNCLAISRQFLLWRPGTFIHRDFVSMPVSLLAEVEEELVSRLAADQLPWLCINGSLFEKYGAKLHLHDICHPTALYSCLRDIGSAQVTFPEYPFILRREPGKSRLPAPLVLERFLLEHAGPATWQELQAFWLEKLCGNKVLLGQYLDRIPNMLRIRRGLFIHLSKLEALKAGLADVVGELIRLQERRRTTAPLLYRRQITTCQRLGIGTPAMLRTLIDHFHPGAFGSSPLRGKKNPAAAGSPPECQPQAVRVSKVLEAYLEQKEGPCSLMELREQAEGRRLQGLDAALRHKTKVLRYSSSEVITRRALAWTDEKQGVLELLAARHLEEREKTGAVFGLCSTVYLQMRDELPKLPERIPWTAVLLHDLLSTGQRYIGIGTRRDIFIAAANAHRIATLNDLQLHILKTRFNGVATRTAFASALRKLGITGQSTTAFICGKDRRVVRDGELIRLR